MAGSFAERLIRAHQMGVAERQAEEDRQRAQEDRKLQQQVLKHQIDRLKLQDALENRAAAMDQFKMLQGQPAQEVPVSAPQATSMPYPGQVGEGPSMGGGTGTVATTLPKVTVPGIEEIGLPSVQLQPQSLQQLLQQRQEETLQQAFLKRQEPYTLREGDRRMVGDDMVAENPRQVQPKPQTESDIQRGLAAAFFKDKHKLPMDQPLDSLQQAQADAEYDAYKASLKPKADSGADDVAVALSNSALDVAARRYLQDGTLPPMGMGKTASAARSKIINRAAEIDPQAAIAANKANYDATKSALTQLTKTSAAVEAFSRTAQANLEQFISAARKVRDSGSPWINRGLRSIDRNVLGKPEQSVYDAARQVALTEIARVVSNPSLAGVLSDSARQEMQAVLSGDATLAQTLKAAELLMQDMKNRKQGLSTEIQTLQDQLKGTPQGESKAQPPSITMPGGQVLTLGSDGKYHAAK